MYVRNVTSIPSHSLVLTFRSFFLLTLVFLSYSYVEEPSPTAKHLCISSLCVAERACLGVGGGEVELTQRKDYEHGILLMRSFSKLCSVCTGLKLICRTS